MTQTKTAPPEVAQQLQQHGLPEEAVQHAMAMGLPLGGILDILTRYRDAGAQVAAAVAEILALFRTTVPTPGARP